MKNGSLVRLRKKNSFTDLIDDEGFTIRFSGRMYLDQDDVMLYLGEDQLFNSTKYSKVLCSKIGNILIGWVRKEYICEIR